MVREDGAPETAPPATGLHSKSRQLGRFSNLGISEILSSVTRNEPELLLGSNLCSPNSSQVWGMSLNTNFTTNVLFLERLLFGSHCTPCQNPTDMSRKTYLEVFWFWSKSVLNSSMPKSNN